MEDGVIKSNLTDEEFDKLFEDSLDALIKRREALTKNERQRIDNDPVFARWETEINNDNEDE